MHAIWIPGGKLRKMEAHLHQPEVLLKRIGAIMVDASQHAFYEQGWNGVKWAKRRNPNIPGIIHDVLVKDRPAPLPRRIRDGPALKDSGDLRKSITWEPYDLRSILVGTNLPYGGVHNTGGESSLGPLTRAARAAIWRWLKPKPKRLRREIGWILNKKFLKEPFTFKVRQRQFVGMTAQILADIQEDLVGVFDGRRART